MKKPSEIKPKGVKTLLELIPSEIKIRILDIMFSNPEKEFYYQELIDRIGLEKRGNIAWALKRLEESGFILKAISGKRKSYNINTGNPIYPELRSIWMKTVGIFAQLEERLSPLQKMIDFAFVYGSFAIGSERADSDIDLMIIGEVKGVEVSKHLADLNIDLAREINYSVFPVAEVVERLNKGDHFWTRLFGEEKVFIIGDSDEFGKMGE